MKNYLKICLAAGAIMMIQSVKAQDKREAVIRQLEQKEKDSVLKTDSLSLFDNLWSKDMVVNTPTNRVGTVEGTKKLLRAGKLHYSSFDRKIEKITFNGNLAIVMGEEIIKPQGNQENAGKTVTRRYTNIWKFDNSRWQMIARQSTIIGVE